MIKKHFFLNWWTEFSFSSAQPSLWSVKWSSHRSSSALMLLWAGNSRRKENQTQKSLIVPFLWVCVNCRSLTAHMCVLCQTTAAAGTAFNHSTGKATRASCGKKRASPASDLRPGASFVILELVVTVDLTKTEIYGVTHKFCWQLL